MVPNRAAHHICVFIELFCGLYGKQNTRFLFLQIIATEKLLPLTEDCLEYKLKLHLLISRI